MFTHSITLYSKNAGWARSVIHSVLWEESLGASFRKTGADPANRVTIRIPDTSAGTSITLGDRIVKGSQGPEIVEKISELDRAGCDVVTVTSVDHRDFGGNMAHREVCGR